MKGAAALLLVSFTLIGCVSFVETLPEGYTGETATFVDTHTNSEGSSAHFFTFAQLNGQYIRDSGNRTRMQNAGRGFNMTPVMVTQTVPTIDQTFTLAGYVYFATDAQGMFGDSMYVEGDLTFTPTAGETYTVRGKLTKEMSTVWLEDSAGVLIGEKFVEEREAKKE